MKLDQLAKLYLFKEFQPGELELISQITKERHTNAGEELFFTGQKAESLFLILQGSVKIFATTDEADEVKITTLSSGQHFGEIPFLTEDARTATAQTVEACHVLEIPYQDLKQLFQKNVGLSEKFHRSLARFLANSLKVTTLDLKKAKEARLRHF